ncbi:MAG: hypothetical protein V4592_21445 [Bacteroidota bacterium]
MKQKGLLPAILLVLISFGIKAQTAPANSPCRNNPQNRQFDYWVGEWDVYATGTTTIVGHSLVQDISGGCAILENWTATNGKGDGKSINFIDPNTHKWKQTWVGSGGMAQEFTNGEYKDDAMKFTTEKLNASGQKMLIHFIFYNQGPDKMRQYYETSVDDGKTWVTGYDFTYLRKKA